MNDNPKYLPIWLAIKNNTLIANIFLMLGKMQCNSPTSFLENASHIWSTTNWSPSTILFSTSIPHRMLVSINLILYILLNIILFISLYSCGKLNISLLFDYLSVIVKVSLFGHCICLSVLIYCFSDSQLFAMVSIPTLTTILDILDIFSCNR